MRIAMMTHSVLPRGGVVHALELSAALAQRGHRVTLVAPAEPGQQWFRPPHCAHRLIRTPAIQGPLVEQVAQRIARLEAALPALLDGLQVDLVHVHDSLGANALATLREQGHCPQPWLRTVHHLDSFTDPRLAAWQTRGWRSADAIGCVSDTWCGHFRQHHGVTASRLFNGVNLRQFGPVPDARDPQRLHALGIAGDGPLVLAVGGIEARKNSVRLLQAFARARNLGHQAGARDWRRAQLVIAGGASLLDHQHVQRQWRDRLTESGLRSGPGEAVLPLGPVSDSLMPALMRRADLLAMPSLVEGFGLAALEALACGTPVLVSDRPPFTEHLKDCPQVAWCDPLEVDSIARGLLDAAQRPRAPTLPAVCRAHDWARSALAHEQWYGTALATATQ